MEYLRIYFKRHVRSVSIAAVSVKRSPPPLDRPLLELVPILPDDFAENIVGLDPLGEGRVWLYMGRQCTVTGTVIYLDMDQTIRA